MYAIVVNTSHKDCPDGYCGLPPHVELIDGIEYVDNTQRNTTMTVVLYDSFFDNVEKNCINPALTYFNYLDIS